MESVPEEIQEKMAGMTPAERATYIAERMRAVATALGASNSVVMVSVSDEPPKPSQWFAAFHGEGLAVRGLLEIGTDTIRRITVVPRKEGVTVYGGGGAG